jgi:hypothetical protein
LAFDITYRDFHAPQRSQLIDSFSDIDIQILPAAIKFPFLKVTLQDSLSGKTARKPVNLNLQQKGLLQMMQLKMPKMIM